MLIIITLVAIIVLGIILNVLDEYHDSFFGCMCILLGAIFLLGSLVCIFSVQVVAETNYQKALYEKKVLEYRLENENNSTVGNELLYSDIVEFNNDLRHTKTWVTNPWTNWFNNAKIASIDYIAIPGLNE